LDLRAAGLRTAGLRAPALRAPVVFFGAAFRPLVLAAPVRPARFTGFFVEVPVLLMAVSLLSRR
jgi:hypothetical protein